ncbi:MAG: T9SS C-terminal target domain-containing protein [Flavobacteriia bacterium]|jgi:hypothetical protein|uniref:T9SS type A sorting domain-containing protein n=1 Tax=Flavobacterium sp. TaxID=239 RepID=UPI0029768ECA|nr:MAG: T9SS C-terminal target domain-containing protein [Flavobacteriia bacterium]
MKKYIYILVIGLLHIISIHCSHSQEVIKLIGFTSNGQTVDNLVKWNAGQTNFTNVIPVDYVGVLGGSSIYNSNNGEYYSRILLNENNNYVSKLLKYNTQNNTITLNEVTSVNNGSGEVDMQNGFLYSYDSDQENNVYLNRYNPTTQLSTNLGYYNSNDIGILFPDGSCYDSDNKIFYFITQDENVKKLVKSTITTNGFSYNVTPLSGPNIIGNIGLEYSNEQNNIYIIYPQFNSNTSTSTLNVGILNSETGEVSNLVNIVEVTGLQVFNRTYDQATETLVFIAIDLDNQQRLYKYNTITNQLVNQALPQNTIIEIEADNYDYALTRFGILGNTENFLNSITIHPNPTKDMLTVHFNNSDSEYEIFDLIGKSVQKGTIQNGQKIDVNHFKKGVYIINLKSNSFNENKKIIVE